MQPAGNEEETLLKENEAASLRFVAQTQIGPPTPEDGEKKKLLLLDPHTLTCYSQVTSSKFQKNSRRLRGTTCLTEAALDRGDYDAMSLRSGLPYCMYHLKSQPQVVQQLLESAPPAAVAQRTHSFIFCDIECSYKSSSGAPFDSRQCCNSIIQIAAVTEDGNSRFNVYIKPSQMQLQQAGDLRAVQEAANSAVSYSPSKGLQMFVDWLVQQQHAQHQAAASGSDAGRIVLVSHFGMGYTFSILAQHALQHGVPLPAVLLADSCLWHKVRWGYQPGPPKLLAEKHAEHGQVAFELLLYEQKVQGRLRLQSSFVLSIQDHLMVLHVDVSLIPAENSDCCKRP
eukprot:gene12521-12655_t